MELAFEQKQRSCLKRTAHLSLAQEQTQELIIPDTMPDAARTLICYAEPELQSKTSRAGSLLVTGNLRASCLYADEAGGLQLLTTDVPFTLKLESSDLQELTQSVVRCSVRSADSRLINSRKVLLRISVLVQADGYEPWTEEVRALTDAPACLQQKTQSYSNAVPVETAERAFQVSEELNVPEGRAKIVRLADCMLQPVVTEQNLVGSKAVMKGTANLQLTYLDEQNELRTLSLAVPFSQYCQLQGDYEQNEDVETTLLVTGVQLEPVDTETGQKLLFGAGILAQCTVIQPQTLTLCEDAYSTRGDFQPQWQEQEYSMRLDVQTLREPIRPSFPAQATAVLDCRVYPDAMALERTADGVIVHVPLRADTVYTDADGAVQSESFRTEVSCKTALDEDCACEAVFQLQPEGYAAAGSGAVELRYDAVFQLQSFAKQKLQNLVGGTLDLTRQPRAERASVVIRRTWRAAAAVGPCQALQDHGAGHPDGQSSDAAGGRGRKASPHSHVRQRRRTMEHRSIYEQIAGRTDGTVYIGVVGPVRTGKSTFIKRFMEQLVLPNIENVYERERATDELPQSGSGRTIMTAEPKFVPNEAARISPDGKTTLRVRLIDSVGYMIPGAVGDTEDGRPRMVTTPWAPEELPMAQAAELGTKKVMEDHSSLGVVVTTDGTVTDIPREDYREAEARAITDMQKTGKPFVVLVNTQSPGAAPAEALCAQLRSEYGVQALAMDCMHMQTQDIGRLLEAVMYAFPVEELRFFLPSWVRALPDGHPVKAALYDAMLERAGALTSLSEAESVLGTLQELEPVDEFRVREVDLGTGTVSCELHLPQALFYEELSRQAGVEIADDEALLQMLQELAQTKKLYDKVQTALEQVKATGYGIVMPGAEELKLEKPEIVKKNGNYAVKLRASAPSIHMLRAQIETEISPMVGGEQESQQLIDYLLGEYEEDTDKLWQSNIFGKSLYELVSEGVTAKIMRMPDDARQKLTKTLGRMINENTGGMICILL